MKKTPWFPGTVKPARPGYYETVDSDDGSRWFNCFDGNLWFFGHSLLSEVGGRGESVMYPQSIVRQWRGLAKKP